MNIQIIKSASKVSFALDYRTSSEATLSRLLKIFTFHIIENVNKTKTLIFPTLSMLKWILKSKKIRGIKLKYYLKTS